MFENLGWLEIVCLVLIGLFIFGPERLPKVIGDAARFLRTARQMARNATSELQNELGTDIDITDLNPRTFVQKHLLSDSEVDDLSRPLREAFGEVETITDSINADADADEPVSLRKGGSGSLSLRKAEPAQPKVPYDLDAT